MSASNQKFAGRLIKSGGGIEYADATLHPKYNAGTGKIETRGRKRKAETPPIHHTTRTALDTAAPKLKVCMDVIKEQFGGIKQFLLAWTVNDDPGIKKMRDKFMSKGVQKVVDMWLPTMDEKFWDISSLMQTVVSRCDQEAASLAEPKNSGPLRYVSGTNEKEKGAVLYGSLCSSLDDMKNFLKEKAPLSWRIFASLDRGMTVKPTAEFVTLNSFASLLNNRNQQMNSYQV
ncbi:hypothetical protein EV426DRAFT_581036 [Tirmania nivea]|nr:hypothetical protein EV426DRAFT_581036 [Tirmania nivea]